MEKGLVNIILELDLDARRVSGRYVIAPSSDAEAQAHVILVCILTMLLDSWPSPKN